MRRDLRELPDADAEERVVVDDPPGDIPDVDAPATGAVRRLDAMPGGRVGDVEHHGDRDGQAETGAALAPRHAALPRR